MAGEIGLRRGGSLPHRTVPEIERKVTAVVVATVLGFRSAVARTTRAITPCGYSIGARKDVSLYARAVGHLGRISNLEII